MIVPLAEVPVISKNVAKKDIFPVKNVNPPSGGLLVSSSRSVVLIIGVNGGLVFKRVGMNEVTDALVEASSPRTYAHSKHTRNRVSKTLYTYRHNNVHLRCIL